MVLPNWATTPSTPYVAISVRDGLFSLFLQCKLIRGFHGQRLTETKGYPREGVAE